MKKLTKFLTSASIGISLSSVIFLIKDYVYASAMKEHEIFTILIAVFTPLFAIGTLLSVLLSKKIDRQKLLTFGLLFSGIFIILLTYLNVYHLQMLMPLMKTNSITLVVMWSVVRCNGEKRRVALHIARAFCRRDFCFEQIYARSN